MDFEKKESGLLIPVAPKLILDGGMIKAAGHYLGQIVRDGEVIDEFEFDNLVVNQGLNYLASAGLAGGSALPNWFIGIFQGNYTPVATDTAANVAANSTECSSYTQATRPAWTPAAPANQSITNAASPATFTFNNAVTVYGAFLISQNTIAGTSGTLFSEALFNAAKSVTSGDQLLLTYVFNLTSS